MEKNSIREIIVCNNCRGDLLWDNGFVLCIECGSKFFIKDGVIQFLKKKNEFYEGVYIRQIKYIPQKNFLKNWFFFNLVQSGVLGEIRKVLCPGGKALDIGCGGGIKWLGIYAETIGMDFSQKSLVEAKKCYSEVVRGNIQKMPFHSASLNLVYGSYIFEHLSAEQKDIFLSEVLRVLKPGGACVLQFDTLSDNWITRFALRDQEAYKKGFIDIDGHIGLEPLSVGIKRIEQSGMDITRVVKFGTTFLQYQATYNWLNISYGDEYVWIKYLSMFVNWILNKRIGIAFEFFVTAVDMLINPFSKIDLATRAIVVAVKPKRV
ncbi:MAG: class I SAM-dependent methyltransferase [Patescibacteria group bacterium]